MEGQMARPAINRAAINALQVIVERRWELAANERLPTAAAELLQRGSLAPEDEALLHDIVALGCFHSKKHPREAFDHYLHVPRSDGSLQCWGFGLQTRQPKLRQHHSLPQKERTVFEAQQGVMEWRQLAVLYTGYSMRCISFSEVPPPSGVGGARRSAAIQEELEAQAEEEGLSVEDTELAHGHMFDAAAFPSADNMLDLLRDQLLPKVLKTPPLPDVSQDTGAPYPTVFSGSNCLKSALVVERGEQAFHPLPEGWECAPSCQEVERPRGIFIFPPTGWEPARATLADAGTLAMVDLPLEPVAALLELSAGQLGGKAEQALGMLRNPAGTGVGDALALAEGATTHLRHCLVDMEKGVAVGTTAGEASAAAAGAAHAAAAAGTEGAAAATVTGAAGAASAAAASSAGAASTGAASGGGVYDDNGGQAAAAAVARTGLESTEDNDEEAAMQEEDEEDEERPAQGSNLADLAEHRRGLTGRPQYMFRSFDARAKGTTVQTPAAPPALSLLGDERAATAFVVSVGSTAKAFCPRRRVGGRTVPHQDVARLMTAEAPLFLLVDPPEAAEDLEQQAGPSSPGAGSSSGASGSVYLFHAAAVANNKGVLAATASLPISELSEARVQPGAALWERLQQLAVPCCDALDAARAKAVLVTLVGDSFVAALRLTGVSILEAELVPRIKEGEGLAWLRHVTGLAEDDAAAAALLATAQQLVNTGFVTEVTLRSAVIHARNRLASKGLTRQRNAINQGALDGHVKRMGGGDFEAGTRIKAAVDAWQEELAALGAGPMEKLEGVNRKKGETTGLIPPRWQAIVEAGWPGADAVFAKALEAGATLMQLATRWSKATKTWRASTEPTTEVKEQLGQRRPVKRQRMV